MNKSKNSSIVTAFMEKHPDWVPPLSSFLPYGSAGFGKQGQEGSREPNLLGNEHSQ